jgi:hypothetical protein
MEEIMTKFIITMAMGLLVMLSAAGGSFASGDERQAGRTSDHDEQYRSKIYGTIQNLPNGMTGIWKVDGKEINVTKTTIIKEKHGKAEVGAYIEVNGTATGNTFNAYKVEVKRGSKEVRIIIGTIESLPTGKYGTWKVNSEAILVKGDTFIREKNGKAQVGAYVEIEGIYSGNAFVARSIEVKRAK